MHPRRQGLVRRGSPLLGHQLLWRVPAVQLGRAAAGGELRGRGRVPDRYAVRVQVRGDNRRPEHARGRVGGRRGDGGGTRLPGQGGRGGEERRVPRVPRVPRVRVDRVRERVDRAQAVVAKSRAVVAARLGAFPGEHAATTRGVSRTVSRPDRHPSCTSTNQYHEAAPHT